MREKFLAVFGILVLVCLPTTEAAHAQSMATDTVLINKSHPLQPTGYTPPSLVTPDVWLAGSAGNQEMLLAPEAAENLTTMFEAAHRDGISLLLASGYRPYEDQTVLYTLARAKDKTVADESIAPPGYSEHQTGLAADVMTTDYFCATESCFAMTKAAAWLHDNSYKYGFIVRYPLYEEQSTGYEYEPWHMRYVGRTLATCLYQNQMTLEQYYGFR